MYMCNVTRSFLIIPNILVFFNIFYNIIQLFNVWEVNRPEYFPQGAGNSSMLSIARGRWPRAIERIELFPAPRGKYSGLLTSQTLNNCILCMKIK